MIGSIFLAMLIGSLTAILMLMSGWPVWVAMTVYALCGILGMVSVAIGDICRPVLSRGAAMVALTLSRVGLWPARKDAYLQPKSIPPLSERRPLRVGK